jgi:hypothetical protein
VRVTVLSADAAVNGSVKLKVPAGWSVTPAAIAVTLDANAEKAVVFKVAPPATPGPSASMQAVLETGRSTYDRRQVRIDYPHIPVQTLLPPATARLARADATLLAHEIGYVMGSGDQVPEALEQLGGNVSLLGDDDLENTTLARFEAIVIGVRAYNTRPRLRALQGRLLDYVNTGGTLVVQYQTPDDALKDKLGPFPFTVSRDRVTEETAAMRVLKSGHALLSRPNRIGPADFDGWIQERGLSFANPWDAKYETLLSCNDTGEPARDGGLLYARYGKGAFIYTGFGWFRQLPAGVPGAYRIFANLVSAGR